MNNMHRKAWRLTGSTEAYSSGRILHAATVFFFFWEDSRMYDQRLQGQTAL